MLRNFYLAALLLIVSCVSALAQSGSIKGKVLDKTTNEPLPFANVIVELNGTQAGGAQTDFDGNFTIKPLQPGKYNLKITFVGYSPQEITNVLVKSDGITFQNVTMAQGVELKEFTVTDYKVPLVDKGSPST